MDSPPPSAPLEPVNLYQYTWPNNNYTTQNPRHIWALFVLALFVLGVIFVVIICCCTSSRRSSRRTRVTFLIPIARRPRVPVSSGATTAITPSSSTGAQEEDEETEPAPGEDDATEPAGEDEIRPARGGGD